MNLDGASNKNSGLVSGNGCIRDSNGVWLMSFTMNIGIFTSMKAKKWATL